MGNKHEDLAIKIIDAYIVDDRIVTKKERIRNAKKEIVEALSAQFLEHQKELAAKDREIERLKMVDKELHAALIANKGLAEKITQSPDQKDKRIEDLEKALGKIEDMDKYDDEPWVEFIRRMRSVATNAFSSPAQAKDGKL